MDGRSARRPPRCQGLCGSQKYTGTEVVMLNCWCWDISSPWSQVKDRRKWAGRVMAVLVSASRTASAVLLGRQVQQHDVPGRSFESGAEHRIRLGRNAGAGARFPEGHQ